MSDDAKVPLPRGAKAGWFTARDGLLYTEAQVRAYGDARERAARAAAFREAVDMAANGGAALPEDWYTARDCLAKLADALRARAEGDGEGGR